MSLTSGYSITPDGELQWVPPGWPYTPPHSLSPPGLTPAELDQRRAAHERRLAAREQHAPDWPPFLIGFRRGRKVDPWRCVIIRNGLRGVSSWHASRILAIAHGKQAS